MNINTAETNRLCRALGIEQYFILDLNLAIANAVMENCNLTNTICMRGACNRGLIKTWGWEATITHMPSFTAEGKETAQVNDTNK